MGHFHFAIHAVARENDGFDLSSHFFFLPEGFLFPATWGAAALSTFRNPPFQAALKKAGGGHVSQTGEPARPGRVPPPPEMRRGLFDQADDQKARGFRQASFSSSIRSSTITFLPRPLMRNTPSAMTAPTAANVFPSRIFSNPFR